MSIFKQTFPPFICRQLNARQDLISLGDQRPIEVLQYTNTKSPWVKMSSMVNYDDEKRGLKGDMLARKYVLYQGTVEVNPNDPNSYAARYGVGSANSAYGGDLGGIYKSDITGKITGGSRQYGLIPMPGITSIDIKSLGAYCSLKQTTVHYYCWDKTQLDDLEILFMRPGYTVLLEWGWSMYIDTFDNTEPYDKVPDVGSINTKISLSSKLSNNSLIKSFDAPTINPFQDNLTQTVLYDQIKRLQHRYSGNYDACLGKIINFSYNLLPNGGYDCTTVLISIGDVIDTLKINSVTGESVTDIQKKDFKTKFEILLEKIKYGVDTDPDIISLRQGASQIKGIDTSCKYINFTKPIDERSTDGSTIYYIQFAYLIYIINEKFNLYNTKEKLFDIEIPVFNNSNVGNGLCIASKYSISIDPTVCLIKNSSATFYSQNTDHKGFDLWQTFAGKGDPFGLNSNGKLGNTYTQLMKQGFNQLPPMNEFLIEDDVLGVIGNIYVSIDAVEQIYKNLIMSNNGSAELGKLIQGILDNVSFALGSINDFGIYVNDNKAVIIDKHYTEYGKDASKESKFQMNLIGNNNVNRSVSLQSKIFPEMSTMIAISAQDRENVAGVQSSTNVYFNKGLSDRLIQTLTETVNNIDDEQNKKLILQNVQNLVDYVNLYLYQLKLPDQNTSVSDINSYLNSLILKVSKDANYRAVIPLSFDVAFDGIGGIVPGNIFVVNADALPVEYSRKNLGFIVTGISHRIIRSEWVTQLTTQFAVLDQDELDKTDAFDSTSIITNDTVSSVITKQFNDYIKSIVYDNLLVAFLQDYYEGNIVYDGFEFNVANKSTSVGNVNNNTTFNPSNNPGDIGSSLSRVISTPVQRLLNLDIAIREYKAAQFGVTRDNFISDVRFQLNGIILNRNGITINDSIGQALGKTRYFNEMVPEIQSYYTKNYDDFVTFINKRSATIEFQCYLLSAAKPSGQLDTTQVFYRRISPAYSILNITKK